MGGSSDSYGFMTASKSFVFGFDDVEIREREFSLNDVGQGVEHRAQSFSGS
jgi:hypothetical protein